MRKLDLNLLLVFEAVYRTRNISRAAAEMEVSQPTLSNALARLRAALDDPLFARTPRGVTPTPRADALIGPVRRALEEIRRITTPEDGFDAATSTREFRILVVDALEGVVMPHLIASAIGNPGLSFRLILAPRTPLVDALEQGEADLAVHVPAPAHRDFRWDILCPIDPVVIARRGHPQIDGGITAAQLRTLPQVTLDMAPGALANAHLLHMASRPERRDMVLASRVTSIPEIVARTDLIGVAARIQAITCAMAGELQILEPPVPLAGQAFHMTWHSRNDGDPGLAWLRDRVHEGVAAAHSGAAPMA